MRKSFDYQQIRLVTNAKDADFQEPRIPERLQENLYGLHADALKGKPKVIEALKKMIRDYPKFPVYKNLLYTAYSVAKNYGAAEQVAEQMYRLHPEYTYARANYAESLLRRPEALGHALEVLHPSLNISEAFPGRQSFHVGEFVVYERVVIQYLAQSGEVQESENRLQMLTASGAGDPRMIRELLSFLEKHRRFEPILPELQIPDLAALYYAGSFMTAEVMQDILQQPNDLLVADLCRILDDLAERSDYWTAEDFPGYIIYTPLHAIILLAELQAEAALPAILRFLSQPNKLADYWFGDYITELLPETMSRFASPAQYGQLFTFSTDRSIDAFTCNIGIIGVVYRALQQPELREAALNWLESIIRYLMPDSSPGGDDNHLNLALSAIIDLKAERLLPLAEQAFEKDLMDIQIAGDYPAFVHQLKTEEIIPNRNYTDLKKAYAYIQGFYFDDFVAPPKSQANNPWLQQIALVQAQKPKNTSGLKEDSFPENVGQNAPCPCGSGKKYKRCHGLKT